MDTPDLRFDGARMAAEVLAEAFPTRVLPVGSEVRVLFGPVGYDKGRLIPYRLSVYDEQPQHLTTVALTDKGLYVKGVEPAACTPNPVEGLGGKHDRCVAAPF